jgi:hypothetical protein
VTFGSASGFVMSDNWSESLSRLRRQVATVQHATNPLTAANRSLANRSPDRLNQLVTDALTIPLAMVVGHEPSDHATKMLLPEQDHALEALLLDRPNESLRVSVAVGCTERCPNESHSLVFKEFQYATAPLPIAIADQYASVCQDAINRFRQVAHDLNDEGFIRVSQRSI